MRKSTRWGLARYGAALAAVALATAARLALDPVLGGLFPFATLLPRRLARRRVRGPGPGAAGDRARRGRLGRGSCCRPAIGSGWKGSRTAAGLLLYLAVGAGDRPARRGAKEARRRADSRADEAVRQREELRITLSGIGEAVLVADGLGRVSSLNPVAEALTGWTTAEAAGRPHR